MRSLPAGDPLRAVCLCSRHVLGWNLANITFECVGKVSFWGKCEFGSDVGGWEFNRVSPVGPCCAFCRPASPSSPVSLHPVLISFDAWVRKPVTLETENLEVCRQLPAWGRGKGFPLGGGDCGSLREVHKLLRGAHDLALQAGSSLSL